MKIYVFGSIISIRELGGIEDGKLKIQFVGVNDGEEVTLRASNGKYAISSLKDGVAKFRAAFLKDGETYTVRVRNGEHILGVPFNYSNGTFYHVYDGVAEEITKMWGAITDLAEALGVTDAKISKFTDGYKTE